MKNNKELGSIESRSIPKNQSFINGSFDIIIETTSSDPNISERQLLQHATMAANEELPKGLCAKMADDAEQCFIEDADGTRMQIGFDLFNKKNE